MTSRPMLPTPMMPRVLALEAPGLAVFFFVPLAGAEVGGAFDDAAVEGEEEGEDELSDGGGVHAGAVADGDVASFCGGGFRCYRSRRRRGLCT